MIPLPPDGVLRFSSFTKRWKPAASEWTLLADHGPRSPRRLLLLARPEDRLILRLLLGELGVVLGDLLIRLAGVALCLRFAHG